MPWQVGAKYAYAATSMTMSMGREFSEKFVKEIQIEEI